jgi:hypothetical protein
LFWLNPKTLLKNPIINIILLIFIGCSQMHYNVFVHDFVATL